MPIDVRGEDDAAGGNALSAARVNLHNRIDSVHARLKAIRAETAALKRSKRPDQQPGKPQTGIDFKALGNAAGRAGSSASTQRAPGRNQKRSLKQSRRGKADAPGSKRQ